MLPANAAGAACRSGLPPAHGVRHSLPSHPTPPGFGRGNRVLTDLPPVSGHALPCPSQAQKQLVRTARARAMVESFGLPFEPLAELVRTWHATTAHAAAASAGCFRFRHEQAQHRAWRRIRLTDPQHLSPCLPLQPCWAQLRSLGCMVAGGSMVHAYMGCPLDTFTGDLDIFAKPVRAARPLQPAGAFERGACSGVQQPAQLEATEVPPACPHAAAGARQAHPCAA